MLEKIDENKTRIKVKWEIHMKEFMWLFTIFIKKHILKGTEEPITRIANKAKEKEI